MTLGVVLVVIVVVLLFIAAVLCVAHPGAVLSQVISLFQAADRSRRRQQHVIAHMRMHRGRGIARFIRCCGG